jgi:hypothetical protein
MSAHARMNGHSHTSNAGPSSNECPSTNGSLLTAAEVVVRADYDRANSPNGNLTTVFNIITKAMLL